MLTVFLVAKILLNTSRHHEISEAVDIELSRDEDSVTSLAVSKSSNKSVIALAGINSSSAEQQRGKNEHLRSFEVDYPPKKAEPGEKRNKKQQKDQKVSQPGSKALSRVSLFKPKYTKPNDIMETYQRITRLSPWRGDGAPRIGAISTGFAPQGEVVIFDAVSSSPQQHHVIGRVRLGDREEAEDLDIAPTGDSGDFKLAYTDGNSVYLSHISPSRRSNSELEKTRVYRIPPNGSKKTSKIRAIRFLSSESLLLLQNFPERSGCELVIVSTNEKNDKGSIKRKVRLHRSMKIGLGLDICPLSESPQLGKQYIVAVSGSDNSIETFTIDYSPKTFFSNFRHYTTLRDVHPFSVTKIAFSTFIPPAQPTSSEIRPQYVKLASVSVGNTVVVHTFPLSPVPPSSRYPRYVLVRPGPSELATTTFSTIMAVLVVAFASVFIQACAEIRGGVPPYLGAQNWLNPRIRSLIAHPYIFETGNPVASVPTSSVPDNSDIPTVQASLSSQLHQTQYVDQREDN